MRLLTLSLVLALLAVYASAVTVPFKWCGSSTDVATISSIVANEYPPKAGDTLSLNITANLSTAVTDGSYNISVTADGWQITGPSGSVSDFRPLPWPTGEVNFTYTYTVPAGAPPASYVVTIKAADQDDAEIFCISLSFKLTLDVASSIADFIHNPGLHGNQQQQQRAGHVPAILKRLQ